MNISWDTVFIAGFIIVVIISLILLIITSYLERKAIRAIRDMPEQKKPFYGLSEKTRAVMAVVLVALGCLGIYHQSLRRDAIRSIRKEQAQQARDKEFYRRNPTNHEISYQFKRNVLIYGETQVVTTAPELPPDFCPQNTEVMWTVTGVTEDASTLYASAFCFIRTPDGVASSLENSPIKEIVVDLKEHTVK